MVAELEDEKQYLQGEAVQTIYFGGGTPSILDVSDLKLLLQTIQANYPIAAKAEVTLEANPDDINMEKLSAWKEIGINRLSVGIQSFFEEELKWMNRAHNANQAAECIDMIHKAGFTNYSIDLIYGSPMLTDDQWKQNVEKVISLKIPHLSCYALTVEERTPLYKLIDTKKSEAVDADKQARQFTMLMEWLKEAGYHHYEVSNFALPGLESRHNSSYWQGKKYLGIGASAHSFNGSERRWNIDNNHLYMNGIREHQPMREKETLTAEQKLNEYLMISLRTSSGIDLNYLKDVWGEKEVSRILKALEKPKLNNFVTIQNNHIILTDEGMLFADGIASSLFV